MIVLVTQMHQKNVKYAITDIFLIKTLIMNHIFAVVVMVKCKKHEF